ncbi:MAG TPA: hypothetical protein VMM35_00355 [Longimicrobiales bacterium]|jgi:hypothetical protein|nr:hypothetical protein [Longimicrobiales bacterium]
MGRKLYEGWLVIAAHFGEIQTQILVALIYAFAIGPMAIVIALARRDLLHKRRLGTAGTAWNEADTVSKPDLERARRMF